MLRSKKEAIAVTAEKLDSSRPSEGQRKKTRLSMPRKLVQNAYECS
jgi:hypothetical protein